MFASKSLLFACLGLAHGQTFFSTSHGSGGSYTSISHGAATLSHQTPSASYAPAAPQVYKTTPVRQVYQQPAPTTYHNPQPTYSRPQPAYSQPSYSRPQAVAAAPTYGEKCSLDYVEKYVQVCTPTLEKECSQDMVKAGIRFSQEYDCYPV